MYCFTASLLVKKSRWFNYKKNAGLKGFLPSKTPRLSCRGFYFLCLKVVSGNFSK